MHPPPAYSTFCPRKNTAIIFKNTGNAVKKQSKSSNYKSDIFENVVLHYVWQGVTTRSNFFLLKMHETTWGDWALPGLTGEKLQRCPYTQLDLRALPHSSREAALRHEHGREDGMEKKGGDRRDQPLYHLSWIHHCLWLDRQMPSFILHFLLIYCFSYCIHNVYISRW